MINSNEEDKTIVYSADNSRVLIYYDVRYIFVFLWEKGDGNASFESVLGRFSKVLDLLLKEFTNRE